MGSKKREAAHILVTEPSHVLWTKDQFTRVVPLDRSKMDEQTVKFSSPHTYKAREPISLFKGKYVAPEEFVAVQPTAFGRYLSVSPGGVPPSYGIDRQAFYDECKRERIRYRANVKRLMSSSLTDERREEIQKEVDVYMDSTVWHTGSFVPVGTKSSNCELRLYSHARAVRAGFTRVSCDDAKGLEYSVYIVATRDVEAFERLVLSEQDEKFTASRINPTSKPLVVTEGVMNGDPQASVASVALTVENEDIIIGGNVSQPCVVYPRKPYRVGDVIGVYMGEYMSPENMYMELGSNLVKVVDPLLKHTWGLDTSSNFRKWRFATNENHLDQAEGADSEHDDLTDQLSIQASVDTYRAHDEWLASALIPIDSRLANCELQTWPRQMTRFKYPHLHSCDSDKTQFDVYVVATQTIARQSQLYLPEGNVQLPGEKKSVAKDVVFESQPLPPSDSKSLNDTTQSTSLYTQLHPEAPPDLDDITFPWVHLFDGPEPSDLKAESEHLFDEKNPSDPEPEPSVQKPTHLVDESGHWINHHANLLLSPSPLTGVTDIQKDVRGRSMLERLAQLFINPGLLRG
jgi:hypothetical protein